MKTRIKRSNCRRVQLKKDVINIFGDEIYYRLFLIRGSGIRYYTINVTRGKESCSCRFGNDKNRAYDIYNKIVKNTVTPCTLCDIAEDLAKE